MTAGLSILAGKALSEEVKRYIPSREKHALGTCLVLDADRTLCIEDTGLIVGRELGIESLIRSAFEKLGYEDDAFTAVSALWSAINPEAYISALERITENLRLRPCWHEILSALTYQVPIIVVTAGIPQVWRRILSNAGHERIPVLGGCHTELDEYAVSATTKGNIVRTLKDLGWTVIAAGDSRVDLPMLIAADEALFIPDHKGSPGLRTKLIGLSSVRHLLVDDQRFEELATCTAREVTEMILRGGKWCAN